LLAAASIASAGGTDLRPSRPPPRETAKSRAQDAQKQKLLAKLRVDAPSRQDQAPTDTLALPIFADRRGP
jgi:hypothetical protein